MHNKKQIDVFCFSYFWVRPEYRDAFIHAFEKLIPATLKEKDCLHYELLEDTETPNYFILFEKFVSKKALDEHEEQPYIQYFVQNEMNVFCEKVTWNVAHSLEL